MKKIFTLFLAIFLFQNLFSIAEQIAPDSDQKQLILTKIEDVIIQDYGIYEIKAGEKVAAPNVTTGLNTIIYGNTLLHQTDIIPAVRGTSFGFRYLLKGFPKGRTIPVTIKVEHPPITNPNTKKTTEISTWDDEAWIGMTNWHTAWIFDETWEVVPGIWTISVIYEGKVLATKTFTVK